MFEDILKQASQEQEDIPFRRWCKAADAVAENEDEQKAKALKRVMNALWMNFTNQQKRRGEEYIIVMGYIGEAKALLTDMNGRIIEF
jgi:hypothetical protein